MSRLGCNVDSTATAQEALALLKERPFDMIIVDAYLPDAHGSEIVRAVRADPRNAATPIVAVSSDDSHENIKLLTVMGANEFVSKPVTAEKLRQLAGLWLRD
jgi:CheY-like chemotaxis protein